MLGTVSSRGGEGRGGGSKGDLKRPNALKTVLQPIFKRLKRTGMKFML